MPNQKGFFHILGLFVLVIGLGVSVYLVQHETKLFSRATSAPIPVPMPVLTLSPKFEVGLEAGEQHDTSKVPLAVESGAKWVRLNFVGSDWSTRSSDVNTYNQIINAYIQQKIKIIGLIGAQSVSGGYDRNHPENFTQPFTDAANNIISHFGDRAKVYELFNEPNDWAGGQSNQVPPRYFAEYLAKVYRQIKITRGRSDITLNSGPLFTHDLDTGAEYLQNTYTAGKSLTGDDDWDTIKSRTGSYPLDGVGYHIYVAQGMNDVNLVESKIHDNLSAIESAINSLDFGKKLWITEFGWGTGQGRVTEQVQASNLTRAFNIFKNDSNIRMAMWFTLMDFDINEWGFVRGDGVRKLAWGAFQEATRGITPSPAASAPIGCRSDSNCPSGYKCQLQACTLVVCPDNNPNCNTCTGKCVAIPTPKLSPTPTSTSTPSATSIPVSVSCTVCGADADKNGSVGIIDMMRVAQCMRIGYSGSAPGNYSCQKADVNGDGKIDASDLNCAREQFGKQCTGPRR